MNGKILAAAVTLCISAASTQAQSQTADTDTVCLHDPYGMACTTQRARLRHELDATCRQDPRGQTCTDLRRKLEAATANATGQTTAANICQRDPLGDACAEQKARNGDPSALEAAQARHAANREAMQRQIAAARAHEEAARRGEIQPDPIASLVADGQTFVRLFTLKMQTLRIGCRADLPDAPPNDACQLIDFAKQIDTKALTDAINGGIDQRTKNCLFIGISRGQSDVPAGCKVANDPRAVNYAVALATILIEPAR